MNLLNFAKKNNGHEEQVYDVMSDPGVSTQQLSRGGRNKPNSRGDGHIGSTKGYQNAVHQYNKTEGSNQRHYQFDPLQPNVSPLVRNIRGKNVPALSPNGYAKPGTHTLSHNHSIESSSPPERQQHPRRSTQQKCSPPPPKRNSNTSPYISNQAQHGEHQIQGSSSSTFDDYLESSSNDISPPNSPSSDYSFPDYPGSPTYSLKHRRMDPNSGTEPEMVDATYAEHYGDAYIGKPIRYIYPQGYGSMRPRSRPWQIALILCGVFAWLNVFIVGHCADRFKNNDDAANDQQMDDDAQIIDSKWCGSQTLYFIWVLSVALTGLSCAYCSIIGYVKARDFAIANGRSQPPGMAGKTDYYVQIEEDAIDDNRRFDGRNGNGAGNYQDSNGKNKGPKKTIYQADGTPRFFGGHIYKPTQAAVSLTSR